MKKRVTTIIAILVILIGLSLLLYPTVSDYLKNLAYRRTISSYTDSVEQLDDESYEKLLADARAFNEKLAEIGVPLPVLTEEELAEYNSLLDLDGTGVMGYISVPKVNISLPIYHGTGDGVLQSGVGHLEGSSLPVGGPATHAVLSAHTGLPSAKLFTNIDQLVIGDTFTVGVLREVLTYEVDQILVVLPYEMDSLIIEAGKDECTLVTCTPYGVNSHRLLVRGHRIPTPETPVKPAVTGGETVATDNGKRPDTGMLLRLAVILAALAALVVLTVLYLCKRIQQRRRPPKE